MSTKETTKGEAQHTSDPTAQVAAESVFATLREQGIDLLAIEKTLKHCICGQPQVIVYARQNYRTGLIKFYTMCTEESRQICRVSKRLRIHRVVFPELATDKAEAKDEAVIQATAKEALANLEAIFEQVEADEAAADEEAATKALAIVEEAQVLVEAIA